MTQDEIIEMYLEVSNKLCNGTEWCWAGVGEPLQLFTKLVAEKAFEEGFYAGFKASGEGWNGEYPFHDRGLDIQQDESVQHELKEAIKERGQAC